MPKANFKGANNTVIPSPKDKKGGPKGEVSFKQENFKVEKASPLVGAGGDSRPQVKDNRPGENRWKMNTGEALKSMDKNRSEISYGPGPKKFGKF